MKMNQYFVQNMMIFDFHIQFYPSVRYSQQLYFGNIQLEEIYHV